MKTRWKSLLFAGILSALLPVASFGANQPTLPANPGGGTSPSASTPENGRNDFLGAWVVGIQAGPAFSPQDLVTIRGTTTTLVSGVGPYLSFNALYGVGRVDPVDLLLGLDVDYNSLPVNSQSSSFSWGNTSTVSLLPTVELRTDKLGNVSLYGSLGLGVNFNGFSNSASLNTFCGSFTCTIAPGTSFAARFGVGLDYFISPNFALNAEIGYLFNLANTAMTVSVPGATTSGSQNVDLSTLFFLFGFHYRSFL